MKFRRLLYRTYRLTYGSVKTHLVYRLDQFLGWPPLFQFPVILLFIAALVGVWAFIYWQSRLEPTLTGSLWWAITHFMDGGTLASDQGRLQRLLALGVTVTGVVLLAFLTGAFASKLSERIEDLRSGRSPVVQKNHVLLLGFDAKVPFLTREFARSHQHLRVVVLVPEDKPRVEAQLRFVQKIPRSRVRTLCRVGDPHSEWVLFRLCAERARTILVIAPPQLPDGRALRWTLSTLLAVRHAVGEDFRGRIVVEARRQNYGPLLHLVGEAGLCGAHQLPINVMGSDDIIARVLAQSIRQAGVYFALRELLSFHGNELYLEALPRECIGHSFDHVHGRVHRGIAVGVMHADGSHLLNPKGSDRTPLQKGDRLIVLEEDAGHFRLGADLPVAARPPQAAAVPVAHPPERLVVLGENRTLPCLITELDRILPVDSELLVGCSALLEEGAVARAIASCRRIAVQRDARDPDDIIDGTESYLFDADGVIILGCEDDHDPDGDASALALLLKLRHAQRLQGRRIRRLVTEVRDPGMAQQIAVSADDYLVGTDVVAMVLARAALHPEMIEAYREIFDPDGAEIFLQPRSLYAGEGPATFGQVMAAARRREEIAIGIFPGGRPKAQRHTEETPGDQLLLDHIEVDENSPVLLNPPRDMEVPSGPEVRIVVLGTVG